MFLQPREPRTGRPARQNRNLARSNRKNRDIIDGSDRGGHRLPETGMMHYSNYLIDNQVLIS
jgi:hypothetical protein